MSVNVGCLKLYPTTRPHEGIEIITSQVLQIQQQGERKGPVKVIKYRETTFPELQIGGGQKPILESGLHF